MFRYANGSRQIAKVRDQHTDSTTSDYAEDISTMTSSCGPTGDRGPIKWGTRTKSICGGENYAGVISAIIKECSETARCRQTSSLYVEDVNTLLPSEKETDTQDVWVRTAKEGAKYRIGMVYATQEVSSIQRNILKNTANWFIGHLNNTDETQQNSRKYYDFADFESLSAALRIGASCE